MLFSRILRNFQNMSRVAAMKEEGMRLEAIQTELKMKPYPARKLMEQADRLGSEGIARRLSVLGRDGCPHEGHGDAAGRGGAAALSGAAAQPVSGARKTRRDRAENAAARGAPGEGSRAGREA